MITVWEASKAFFRGLAISSATRQKKEKAKKNPDTEGEIKERRKQVNKQPIS